MRITSISNTYQNKYVNKQTSAPVKKVNYLTLANQIGTNNTSFGKSITFTIPFKLPDFSFSKKKKQLKSYNLSDATIEKILNYSNEQYQRVLKLLSNGIDEEFLSKFAELENDKYKKADDLSTKGIDGESVSRFIDLDETAYKKGIHHLSEGHPPIVAACIAPLNDEQTKLALDFYSQDIDINVAAELAQFDEEKRQKCLDISKKGISMLESIGIAEIPDDKVKNIDELIKLKVGDENITDFSRLDDESYQKAISLFNEGVLPEFIIDIIDVELHPEENEEYNKYRERGYSKSASFALTILSDEEKESINDLRTKNPDITQILKTDCDINLITRQNDNKVEAILSREIRNSSGTQITLVYTFDEDGKSTTSRVEEYSNNATSSTMKKQANVFNLKYDKFGQIREINQVIEHPKDKYVIGVLHSKLSNKLKGAFETVYFDINDFKTGNSENSNEVDFDIEKSVTAKGIPVSTVTQEEDGTITYNEHLKVNNCTTDRIYKEKKDNKGNIEYSYYSYKINDDETNSILLDTQREFIRNKDGSVTNTINGITYTIQYDDNNRTITISDGKKKEILKTEGVLAYYSQDVIWNTIKNIHADSLMTIASNIDKWNFVSDESSLADGYSNALYTGTNVSIINHETGHFKDYEVKPISLNKKLIKTYKEEMKKFETTVPYNEQEFVQYFSPRADLNDASGLGEFVAETNMLLSGYGSDSENTKSRGQLLVRFFPKTIAMAANLLGKNSKKSILS